MGSWDGLVARGEVQALMIKMRDRFDWGCSSEDEVQQEVVNISPLNSLQHL